MSTKTSPFPQRHSVRSHLVKITPLRAPTLAGSGSLIFPPTLLDPLAVPVTSHTSISSNAFQRPNTHRATTTRMRRRPTSKHAIAAKPVLPCRHSIMFVRIQTQLPLPTTCHISPITPCLPTANAPVLLAQPIATHMASIFRITTRH